MLVISNPFTEKLKTYLYTKGEKKKKFLLDRFLCYSRDFGVIVHFFSPNYELSVEWSTSTSYPYSTSPFQTLIQLYNKMEISPGVEETFPYPLSITRDAFADNNEFDPDDFLFSYHRFTSLETLLSDLSDLSKALNLDLLDLVNNEYANFIQLGQSISCGLELIDNVSHDVAKFNKSVKQTVDDLTASSCSAASVLKHKKRLNLLKNRIKLIILLHEQCTSFEVLLGLDADQTSPLDMLNKVNTLATLYFSVVKIYSVLMEANHANESVGSNNFQNKTIQSNSQDLHSTGIISSDNTPSEDICGSFEKSVRTKVVSLNFEFKLYMNELQAFAKKNTTEYSDLLLLLLQISRITGQSLHVFNKEM